MFLPYTYIYIKQKLFSGMLQAFNLCAMKQILRWMADYSLENRP